MKSASEYWRRNLRLVIISLIVWFAAVGITLIKDHTDSSQSPDHLPSTAVSA